MSYIQDIIRRVKEQNNDQPEFVQACNRGFEHQ
jgi:hypothetical protein